MLDPLLAWRDQFPILDRTTYLISNSLGPMPEAASDALAEYAEMWNMRGIKAWEEGWWDIVTEIGDLAAPLLGAPPGTVVMQPSVTVASAIVRSCFDWAGARNRIVHTELEFPSVMYLYSGAQAEGAEVVVVPTSGDGITVDLERLLDAIDDRTALVPISHVAFKSAFVQDAAAICEKAHRVGARVCLDVYQSAGVMPLEIEAWNADFAVGGCLKWLCGGPGNAFLYARPDLCDRLEPQVTGWMAADEPFAFELELTRADSIRRFLTGTPSVPAHMVARSGLEIINQIGPQAIREKSVVLTERIIERADRYGIDVATPRESHRRGGTVTLAPPDAEPIARQLLDEDILIDYRPGAGIRLAPHFYNSGEECDRAVDRIAELAPVPFKVSSGDSA
jgi:kynureninase